MSPLRWLVVAAFLVTACERSGAPTPSESQSAAAPMPTVSAPPPSSPALAPSPAPSSSPNEDDDDDDIDKPWGTDFEIDANADWYFGYVPMPVHFSARAMNGTPPFTFTWSFGDGSKEETGEKIVHVYDKTGQYQAFVIGRDSTGDTYRVDFVLAAVTPESYAKIKGLDVSQLLPLPTPTATP